MTKPLALTALTILASASQAAEQVSREDVVPTLPTILIVGEQEAGTGYTKKNVVSATRTETPLKQIPQSVQVITRALIEDQQSVTVSEALANASAVVTNAPFSTPAFETTRIRGFAAEQLVDGFTQFYNPGDRESLINVQSLEVLKGSNALLYAGGSGAPVGGVINIVSKMPEKKASTLVGMKLGSQQFVQPFFDINRPITEKTLFRLTGEYTSAESNIDVIKQKRYNINPSLTVLPSENTKLTLQGKFSRWKQQEYQGLPATGTVTGNFRIRDSLFIGNPDVPDSRSSFNGVAIGVDHDLRNQWTLSAKARVGESDFDERAQSIVGADGFAANSPFLGSQWGLGNVYLTQKQRERSIVTNATYKFSHGRTRHVVLLGADYSRLSDSGYLSFADTGTFVDLAAPSFMSPYVQPANSILTTFQDGDIKNTTHGLYTQLQSHVDERLHITAGVRRAHVTVDYTEKTLGARQVSEKSALLPRIGAVYDLNTVLSVFASYGEGLRGQPFSIFAPGVKPVPAASTSQEAGIKFNANDKLSGQVAFFDIDRSKVVTGFPGTPTGEQRSRGVDGDFVWRMLPGWTMLGNYAHLNATYSADASSTVKRGNQLAGVPKSSGRLWLNHDFSGNKLSGLQVGAGVYWQSEVFIDDANLFKADRFHTIDASASYRTGPYTLGLSVRNLTGKDYFQYYSYFGGRVRPDDGTPVYLTLTYRY